MVQVAESVADLIEQLVSEAGAKVFDLELPGSQGGTLRVYLCNPDGSIKGVGLEHCTRVNRKLFNSLELDALIPGGFELEVSTPGVNRRLRKPEHFAGAVGERIRVKLDKVGSDCSDGTIAKSSVLGVLKSFDGTVLEVEDEKKAVIQFPFAAVREASVDFDFGK